MELKIIARIKSDFPTKFGIPRQSNIVNTLQSFIIFEPEYRNADAIRGLEDFSHLWLIWGFSETQRDTWTPTVRPPRLGGNTRVGVFATRAPYRPNAIGLSCVTLKHVEPHSKWGPVIHVLGADLMDKTPIYDIKPYLSYADSHPDAISGFASEPPARALAVHDPNHCIEILPKEKQTALRDVLALNPRPSYQHDPTRVYGLAFAGYEVKFSIQEEILTVHAIEKQNSHQ